MTAKPSSMNGARTPAKPRWKRGEVRPLTTDERASFAILSLYLLAFCLCMFVYWDSLLLKVLGATAVVGGAFLFVAAFFDTEGRGQGSSLHPLRSYLLSVFITLLVLFSVRLIGGMITNSIGSATVFYGGLLAALVVFRKALVQVGTTMLVVVFLFVTINNWHDVLAGEMKFKAAIRESGRIVFQIGPIKDVANLLVAGNYMGYLSRIDYRDEQINILAVRTVAGAHDDELEKTKAILDLVSNEILYVSDPEDGIEYAKDPINTLISGGGDCEDQALLLCSLLESVGVKTYIVFSDTHVFALVRFSRSYPELTVAPHVYVDGVPCYALDAADPGATIGRSASPPNRIKRVFDVRDKTPVPFLRYGSGDAPVSN